jgi:DNA-binding response OmpR family regulator
MDGHYISYSNFSYFCITKKMAHKVLIYDDDEDILAICATILRNKGFEVLCKKDCRQLISDIENFQPAVILMDNWLPEIGGVKAIQLIKSTEHLKDIPVIFFSANSRVNELGKEAGADYVLPKPFDLNDLETLVGNAATQQLQQKND